MRINPIAESALNIYLQQNNGSLLDSSCPPGPFGVEIAGMDAVAGSYVLEYIADVGAQDKSGTALYKDVAAEVSALGSRSCLLISGTDEDVSFKELIILYPLLSERAEQADDVSFLLCDCADNLAAWKKRYSKNNIHGLILYTTAQTELSMQYSEDHSVAAIGVPMVMSNMFAVAGLISQYLHEFFRSLTNYD